MKITHLKTYLLAFLWLPIFHFAPTVAQPYCTVRTFNVLDGLPANNISSMTQDENDLMWISTWNGLCCFNGIRFNTFGSASDVITPLPSRRVFSIKADGENNIWCITYDRKLYILDTHTCQFINASDRTQKRFGEDLRIRNLYMLPDGHVWATCENKPYICLQFDARTIGSDDDGKTILRHVMGDKNTTIKKIIADSLGNQWIVSDRHTQTIDGRVRLQQPFEHIQSVGKSVFLATENGQLLRYTNGKTASVNIAATKIKQLACLDRQLIVATDKGLLVLNEQGHEQANVNLSGAEQFFIDSAKRIWVFSDTPSSGSASGLWLVQPQQHWKAEWIACHADQAAATISSRNPLFHEDAQHTVWVVPLGGTFSWFDERDRCLRPYDLQPNDRWGHQLHDIDKFFSDAQGNLWLSGAGRLWLINSSLRDFFFIDLKSDYEARAVQFLPNNAIRIGCSDGQLHLLPSAADATSLPNNAQRTTQKLTSSRIYALFTDDQQRTWIGTKGDGIYVFDGTSTKHFLHDVSQPNSLADNTVYDFDQDPQGNIWIATYGGGVCKAEIKDNSITFSAPKGYPKDKFRNARRITHTQDGTLLISTTDGLITMRDGTCYATTYAEGRPTALLAQDVMQTLVSRSGDIYVLTQAGDLQKIASKNLLANNLQLQRVLKQPLAAFGRVLSLIEDRQQRLWVVAENSICCVQPKTGEQQLFGRNALGGETEFTEAKPQMSALTGQILLGAIGGSVIFDPEHLHPSNYKPKIIFTSVLYHGDNQMHPILNRQELEVAANKRNFTINFAALDYRNNDMVEYAYLVEGIDKEWNHAGKSRSASYNHFPAGRYKLRVRSTNADGVWTDNEQTLIIHALPTFWESGWGTAVKWLLLGALLCGIYWILRTHDRNKMKDQMNQMKIKFFTEIGHKLRTPLTLIGGPVADVLDHEENLSERSRQHLEMVRRNARNMLTLTNKMIEHEDPRHYIEETGLTFDEPIADNNAAAATNAEEKATPTPTDDANGPQEEKPTLLVVEDNADLRLFLSSILSADYRVLLAGNGRIGLEKTIQEMPDFIISDVMMPEMDGLTMIHHIKQNKDICHIPIVVLSAKASMDDRLQGLSEGIDDYITKPFSATYLKHRVANIISQRRALQESMLEQLENNFNQPTTSAPNANDYKLESPQVIDADQEMMKKLLAFVESRISDTDLKVDDMAAAVGQSRTIFFNKIKSIVGMAPADFLRHLRMQRAEELIAKSNMPFSQIAYAVGFSDPRYFGKCFKKATGMSPSDYRSASTEAPSDATPEAS